MGLEGPIIYDLFKHAREIEGGCVEDTLLCRSEKVLDANIHHIKNSCGKELVLAEEVTVGSLVSLDVGEDGFVLCY